MVTELGNDFITCRLEWWYGICLSEKLQSLPLPIVVPIPAIFVVSASKDLDGMVRIDVSAFVRSAILVPHGGEDLTPRFMKD
jgi:hypothetical protein